MNSYCKVSIARSMKAFNHGCAFGRIWSIILFLLQYSRTVTLLNSKPPSERISITTSFGTILRNSVLHQLDQKIIYPHYDFKHLTEKYFEIGMKLDDFLIQLVKYCNCWIHDGRNYKKLRPVVSYYQKKLEAFLDQYWDYYAKL